MPSAENRESSPIWRLSRLDKLGLLVVTGRDATSLLQGQTTCDVKALPAGASILGALCNPKGRVIAVFRIFAEEGRHYLLTHAGMVETLRVRLQRYVLRSEVSITDPGPNWCALGLIGRVDFPSALAAHLTLPDAVGRVTRTPDGAFLLRVDSEAEPKFIILAPRTVAERFETALLESAEVERLSLSDWDYQDIRDGVPTVTPACTEEFVPQMLNLDLLGGISFTKGCYTGQEVVARSHYLGTLKRRMYRLQVECDRNPEPGARMFTSRDESSIGQIVNAVATGDSRYQLLAVLNTEAAARGDLRLWSPAGPQAECLELPYLERPHPTAAES